jgi:hypothetical protein
VGGEHGGLREEGGVDICVRVAGKREGDAVADDDAVCGGAGTEGGADGRARYISVLGQPSARGVRRGGGVGGREREEGTEGRVGGEGSELGSGGGDGFYVRARQVDEGVLPGHARGWLSVLEWGAGAEEPAVEVLCAPGGDGGVHAVLHRQHCGGQRGSGRGCGGVGCEGGRVDEGREGVHAQGVRDGGLAGEEEWDRVGADEAARALKRSVGTGIGVGLGGG